MIARYLPATQAGDVVALCCAPERGALARAAATLGFGRTDLVPAGFSRLRAGLFAFFGHCKQQAGPGTALMSAQLCPVVAQMAILAGLKPAFVDVEAGAATPSAAQYAPAIDASTRCVVVAPLYGHLQKSWSELFAALGSAQLLLDLAQGLELDLATTGLPQRAQAVGYSFGLGKGLDTGGALLLSTAGISADLVCSSRLRGFASWVLGVSIHAMVSSGMYPLLARRLDRPLSEKEARPHNSSPQPADLIAGLWMRKLPGLKRAVSVARERSRLVATELEHHGSLAAGAFFDPHATHLRQLVRFRDAEKARRALVLLRGSGVDCAPAGEPLPHDYLGPAYRGTFPNAEAFRRETLRLGFLGRLGPADFERLLHALRKALAH